jgi:hypothetical protein
MNVPIHKLAEYVAYAALLSGCAVYAEYGDWLHLTWLYADCLC